MAMQPSMLWKIPLQGVVARCRTDCREHFVPVLRSLVVLVLRSLVVLVLRSLVVLVLRSLVERC